MLIYFLFVLLQRTHTSVDLFTFLTEEQLDQLENSLLTDEESYFRPQLLHINIAGIDFLMWDEHLAAGNDLGDEEQQEMEEQEELEEHEEFVAMMSTSASLVISSMFEEFNQYYSNQY